MSLEDRSSAEETFRELETQLASLRTAAKSLREQRPSRMENIFHPGRQARREAEFGAAVASAIAKLGSAMREALKQQESNLAGVERHFLQVRDEGLASFKTELEKLRGEQEGLGREQAGAIEKVAERVAKMELQLKQLEQLEQLAQLAREHAQKIEQLAGGQQEFANELRERIQHVLDEQRVAIRQLSLKASEDAVLSDRARRATESKLEELAKQLPKRRQ